MQEIQLANMWPRLLRGMPNVDVVEEQEGVVIYLDGNNMSPAVKELFKTLKDFLGVGLVKAGAFTRKVTSDDAGVFKNEQDNYATVVKEVGYFVLNVGDPDPYVVTGKKLNQYNLNGSEEMPEHIRKELERLRAEDHPNWVWSPIPPQNSTDRVGIKIPEGYSFKIFKKWWNLATPEAEAGGFIVPEPDDSGIYPISAESAAGYSTVMHD